MGAEGDDRITPAFGGDNCGAARPGAGDNSDTSAENVAVAGDWMKGALRVGSGKLAGLGCGEWSYGFVSSWSMSRSTMRGCFRRLDLGCACIVAAPYVDGGDVGAMDGEAEPLLGWVWTAPLTGAKLGDGFDTEAVRECALDFTGPLLGEVTTITASGRGLPTMASIRPRSR